MCRCLGRACAGVLILVVAGCTVDSFLSPQICVFCVYGPKQTVSGTVGEVSAMLEAGLSDAGVLLSIKRVGSDYRIAGEWPKSHTVFCLHLSQKKEPGGIKTLVHMQWDRGGDEELWQLVVKILTTPDDADDASKPLRQPLTTARSAL